MAEQQRSFTERVEAFALRWLTQTINEIAATASPHFLRRYVSMLPVVRQHGIRDAIAMTRYSDSGLWHAMIEEYWKHGKFGPLELQQHIKTAINVAITMYEHDCPHSMAKVSWNFTLTDREYLDRKKKRGKKPQQNGGLFAESESE